MRHGPLVYAACLRHLGRTHLAEDAAQAVFLLLAKNAGKIRVHTTLIPWLLSTTKLVCRDVSRSEKRRAKREVPLDEDLAVTDSSANSVLFEALESLKGPEREAIVLRFVQGLSLAEVGQAQGVTEDAARMRVQRALGRLRTQLTPTLSVSEALSQRFARPDLSSPVAKSIAAHFRPPMMTLITVATGCGAACLLIATYVQTGPHAFNAFTTPSVKASPSYDKFGESISNPIPRDAPSSVTLDKPFTLVYDMTRSDLRTKAMKQFAIEQLRDNLQKRLDADEITKDQRDKAMAKALADDASGPSRARLTFSFDGKDLLIDQTASNPSSDLVTLLHDDKTYTFAPGQHMESERYEGIVPYSISDVPFVGPALPYMPVEKGGKVLYLLMTPFPETLGQPNRLVYVNGKIARNKHGSVEKVTLGTRSPSDEFDVSKDVPLVGQWVGSQISWAKYMHLGGYPDQGKPQNKTVYTLVSASDSALGSEFFTPEHYLADGDRVHLNLPDNRTVVFDYQRAKGGYGDQVNAALKGTQP